MSNASPPQPTWKPAVTVAAVIEHNGLFLMIEEETHEGLRINQPAGHLEPGESLIEACVRETLEETAHDFTPNALVGTYLSRNLSKTQYKHPSFLRFAFCGVIGAAHARALDEGIVRTMWMSRDELAACRERHRSDLVLRCVDDYLAGQRAPLALVYSDPSVYQGDVQGSQQA
ncbi:NUDIX hydrolase [Massilia sp. W12]|uniref:NUDIX hydrolase n=1 Tax=Massilia sp. W12 TaxID=3126507 RepID=UPI0030D449D5